MADGTHRHCEKGTNGQTAKSLDRLDFIEEEAVVFGRANKIWPNVNNFITSTFVRVNLFQLRSRLLQIIF